MRRPSPRRARVAGIGALLATAVACALPAVAGADVMTLGSALTTAPDHLSGPTNPCDPPPDHGCQLLSQITVPQPGALKVVRIEIRDDAFAIDARVFVYRGGTIFYPTGKVDIKGHQGGGPASSVNVLPEDYPVQAGDKIGVETFGSIVDFNPPSPATFTELLAGYAPDIGPMTFAGELAMNVDVDAGATGTPPPGGGGGGQGGGGSTPAPPPPAITVPKDTTANADGSVDLSANCRAIPGSGSTCSGAVVLTSGDDGGGLTSIVRHGFVARTVKKHAKPKVVTIGSAKFTIRVGRHKRIHVRLSRRARQLLAAGLRIGTTAVLKLRDAKGKLHVTQRRMTIKPHPKPRRRKR